MLRFLLMFLIPLLISACAQSVEHMSSNVVKNTSNFQEQHFYFSSCDSMQLSQQNIYLLQELSDALKKHPTYCIFIKGKSNATDDVNLDLKQSQQRINAVTAVLMKNGVTENQIITTAQGGLFNALDQNTSKACRVDVLIRATCQ